MPILQAFSDYNYVKIDNRPGNQLTLFDF
jgi:hypothetical protein